MRSKIFIISLILSIAPALAQKINFSFKAGAVFTNMHITIKDMPISLNFTSRLNPSVGLSANYPLNKNFSLQSEICYVLYSSDMSFGYTINADKDDISKGTVYPSINVNFPTFYLPLMLKYNANKNLALYAGIYTLRRGDIKVKLNSIAAQAINDNFIKQQISAGTVENVVENQLESNMYKWNGGLLAGLQYSLGKHFFADLRVQRSCISMAKNMNLRTIISNYIDIPQGLNLKPQMYLSSIELSLNYNL